MPPRWVFSGVPEEKTIGDIPGESGISQESRGYPERRGRFSQWSGADYWRGQKVPNSVATTIMATSEIRGPMIDVMKMSK